MREKTKKQQTIKYLICLLAILMLALIAITGAWFTDTQTGEEVTVNFGNVEIALGNDTNVTVLDSNAQTVNRDIMPGDTIRASIQVGKATDTEDFYWKAKATVTIVGTSTTLDSGWSTETYNTKEDTSAVNIDFLLDGNKYGNEFENKQVTIGYEVRAIQMANLTEEQAGNLIENTNETNWASGNFSAEEQEVVASEGLVYQLCSKQDLMGDGNLYYVPDENGTEMFLTSIGTCTDTEIVVASEHNGYPVVGVVGAIDMSTYIVNSIAGPAINMVDGTITYNTTITSVTLPRSIKHIDLFAFGAMSSVNVNISELSNLEFVGENAFGQSGIKSIEIPSSITSIGNNSFDGCGSLSTVIFEEGSQLQSIGEGVFGSCTALKSIEIPRAVTSIGNTAFYGCSSLNKVIFEEGSQLQSIGNSAFNSCKPLKSIEIPRGVTSIGSAAFGGCSSLNTVTFEEGSQLQSIGGSAFISCEALTSIEIPRGVTVIAENAFYNCGSLNKVYYMGTESDWNLISITGDYSLTNATRYYYSETDTGADNIWHYENGVPTVW